MKNAAKKIMSKIVLLRSEDSVSACSYRDIADYLSVNDVDLILVHTQKTKDTEIIPKIKSACKNANIIAVTESDDSEILCHAFDCSIDDFVSIQTPDELFLMRVMWALKRKYSADNFEKNIEILSLAKILDKKTKFYRKEYTNKIFDKEYKSVLNSKNKTSYLMMISSDLIFPVKELAECINKIMRFSDIAGFYSDEKICLLLRNTSKDGVKQFFVRIKNIIGKKSSLSASAMNITDKPYADAVAVLNNILVKACKKPNTLIFDDDKEAKDALYPLRTSEISNLLKKSLVKKIDKTIHPAFFKMFAIYEPKFFNTKVIQSVGKNKSTFTFKSNLCYAQLALSYGNSDIITVEIDCIFYGKEKIEVCELNIDDVTGELIENLIQSVASRYKQALDGKE